ncbi:MAG: family 10 glycosylhydrolase [Myxococcales bacterium]
MRASASSLAFIFLVLALAACSTEPTSGLDASVVAPADATVADPPDADVLPVDAAMPGPDAAKLVTDAGDPCSAPGVQKIIKLEASPDTLKLVRGGEVELTVRATFSTGCVREVTTVYFTVSAPTVATVTTSAEAITVRALANGTAELTASTEQGGGGVVSNTVAVTVGNPLPTNTETRAVWVTRFAITNEAALKALLDKAKANHFNTVFLQVRGTGEAYYTSSLVPSWGGGKGLGQDPGWDPLAVGVTYGHSLGLKVHAYLNAMTGWTKTDAGPNPIPDTTPKHILAAHPEYICKTSTGAYPNDDGYVWVGADPSYRTHLADVAEEVLTRYDVDGIHLDRIRTPCSDCCHTAKLDADFAAAGGTWADFSRKQIDETVKAIYDRMIAKKPSLMLSAAVWGIHKRLTNCTGATSEGWSGYHQDSVGWAQKGFIDMLNPMIYWPIKDGACTDWAALADYFSANANGRQVVAGMTAARGSFPELAADIDYARQTKLAGTVVFASSYLDQFTLWDDYLAGPYTDTVPPTPMTHR